MEILRFDDVEGSSARRKNSSRGMIVVGLVATLFGIGTAFASTTITINSGDSVNVGQGVSQVAACDDNIGISAGVKTPIDGYGKTNGKPAFTTQTINFSGVNQSKYDTATGTGCGGEIFELQIFHPDGNSGNFSVYQCGQLGLHPNPDSDDLYQFDDSSSMYLANKVTCQNNGTILIQVPVSTTVSSFAVPIGKYNNGHSELVKLLDLSYFTLVSRSA